MGRPKKNEVIHEDVMPKYSLLRYLDDDTYVQLYRNYNNTEQRIKLLRSELLELSEILKKISEQG